MKALACLATAAALSALGCKSEPKETAAAAPPSAMDAAKTGWSTDVEKAFADAKSKNMPVMLEFTGSTWCPQCKVMTKNVFSKPEFIGAASKKVLLVEIDVPFTGQADQAADPALAKRNTEYAVKYGVEEFPQVILFKPDGKEITRFFAADHPTTEDFLARLDKELGTKSGA